MSKIARRTARPGTAAGSYRNSSRLRPLDEIGDDEEIALVVHAGDDIELEGETLGIGLGVVTWGCPLGGEPARESCLGLAAQFNRLGLPLRARGSAVHELRQDGRARLWAIGAAPGNLDGVLDRLRQVGEKLGHGPTALEIVLRAQPSPLINGDVAALGDTDQRVMRLEIVRAFEIGLVGGDDGQLRVISEIEQERLDNPLLLKPVPLDFDIEPIAEDALERVEGRLGEAEIVGGERAVDHSLGAAGQRHQATLIEREMFSGDHGLARVGTVTIGLGGKLDEVGVAGGVLGEQSDAAVIDVPQRLGLRRHASVWLRSSV